jgi:hypothetical protein
MSEEIETTPEVVEESVDAVEETVADEVAPTETESV